MTEEKDLLTMKALNEARKAFQKYFSDRGYDPAYWDYRFTCWEVDSSLTSRLHRYEIEGECKGEQAKEK